MTMLIAETKKNMSPHECFDCYKIAGIGEYMNVITDGKETRYQCIPCKRKSEGWNDFYRCYSNGHHVDYEKCDEDFI
jgi:hypothetical protein